MKRFIIFAFNEASRVMAVVLFCAFLAACGEVDVSHYKGDGRIVAVGKGIPRGYEVDFDRMDLSRPFSKTYRIINYPLIGKTLDFTLRVRGKQADLEGLLGGFLSFRLSTFENVEIFHCFGELKDWQHSERGVNAETDEWDFYFMDRHAKGSFFNPEETEPIPGLNRLHLEVKYDPRDTTKNIMGTIQLQAGGYW